MNPKSWMNDMKDDIWNKKLNKIVIPGTHDSGTYCINKHSKFTKRLGPLNGLVNAVAAKWSRTQACSIADQLCMGVRYIDLRSILKQSDDTLYLEHGFYAGKLMDELKGVAEFVHGYPGEVVILDMNHIKKCNMEHMVRMLQKIEDMFSTQGENENGLLCPPPIGSEFNLTYGEMIKSNHRVILSITSEPEKYDSTFDYKKLCDQFSWIWCSEKNIVSPWANADKVNKLKAKLMKSEIQKKTNDAFYVTQTILTPGPKDFILGWFRPPRNLKQLAGKVNKELPAWFEDFNRDHHLNIAIIDWIPQDLINQMINFNKAN